MQSSVSTAPHSYQHTHYETHGVHTVQLCPPRITICIQTTNSELFNQTHYSWNYRHLLHPSQLALNYLLCHFCSSNYVWAAWFVPFVLPSCTMCIGRQKCPWRTQAQQFLKAQIIHEACLAYKCTHIHTHTHTYIHKQVLLVRCESVWKTQTYIHVFCVHIVKAWEGEDVSDVMITASRSLRGARPPHPLISGLFIYLSLNVSVCSGYGPQTSQKHSLTEDLKEEWFPTTWAHKKRFTLSKTKHKNDPCVSFLHVAASRADLLADIWFHIECFT